MQDGEAQPKNCQGRGQMMQAGKDLRPGGEASLQALRLGHNRGCFQQQYCQIETNTQGHFPQQGMPIPVNQGVPEAFGTANIQKQSQ